MMTTAILSITLQNSLVTTQLYFQLNPNPLVTIHIPISYHDLNYRVLDHFSEAEPKKKVISLSFLCVLLIGLVWLISFKKVKHAKWKLPPSPPKLPIIGNLLQLGELPHRCLHELSKKYGSVMFLRLGFVPMVVISSSEAASQVLKAHDLECCSRTRTVATGVFSHDYKDISFAPYGEYWRQMRKVAVIEFFSLKKVEHFRYIREEEIDMLVKKLSESALKQSPVDLNETLFWLTSSVLYRVALGHNFHDSELIGKDRIQGFVFDAVTSLGNFTFSDFFPCGLGRLIDWASGTKRRLNKVSAELDAFFQLVIDDHLKRGVTKRDHHQDIVDVLLNIVRSQGEDDAFALTIDHMKGFLMDIFLAGIDTGAITMIWAMTELARNPRVMRKVQTEIRRCLGNKKRITEDDLGDLHYLKLVIKETFRLHPAVPLLLPRETMAHVKIQGYDIPPKTRLQINVWAIGRDPKLWTDPDEFIPERFIDSPIDFRGHHYELLPFGSGRRICPGISMAIALVELGLANLLHFFNWELPDGMRESDIDVGEAGTLTIVKKVPLKLVPVRHL